MTSDPTRASLLVRLRDPRDSEAWERFVKIYSPMVFRAALRAGLQEADAADVAQEVMHSVHGRIERFDYDPDKGSFRGWLRQVTRTRIADWSDRRKRQPVGAGGTDMAVRISDHASPEEEQVWEADYQQALFQAAIEKIRPEFKESTFTAFWLTAVEGLPPGDVASELKLSPGAVYIARSRVTARLREVIQSWERDDEGRHDH
jgi:RNA polymerase sigma-70 factor (ECF subfamily)